MYGHPHANPITLDGPYPLRGDIHCFFPLVSETDFCGEFKSSTP